MNKSIMYHQKDALNLLPFGKTLDTNKHQLFNSFLSVSFQTLKLKPTSLYLIFSYLFLKAYLPDR